MESSNAVRLYLRKYGSDTLTLAKSAGEVVENQKNKKVKSLEELGSIVGNPLQGEKTINFKVLDFLMELYEATKNISAEGKFSLTELRNKHKLSPEITKVLTLQKIVIQVNPGARSPQYKWNSIRPTIYMAREVSEDAKKEREHKSTAMIPVHAPEKVDSPTPPQIIEIPVAAPIDYDEVARRVIAAMPQTQTDLTPVMNHVKKELQTACEKMHVSACKNAVGWLQQNIGIIIENNFGDVILKHIERLQPAVKYVDKIIEHHHYIDKDEKKTLLQKFGISR